MKNLIRHPDFYPEGSPERALTGFLFAWSKNNWSEMAEYCQKTWLPKPEIIDNIALLKKQRIKLGLPPLSEKQLNLVTPEILISPEEALKNQFSSFKLIIGYIKEVFMKDGLDPNIITDATVTMRYQMKGMNNRWNHKIYGETFQFRLVREKAPREPSIDGDWGVNPISFKILKKASGIAKHLLN